MIRYRGYELEAEGDQQVTIVDSEDGLLSVAGSFEEARKIVDGWMGPK